MSNDMGIVSSNNPWHKPISNITWGFVFTVMNFDFFNLKYVLVTIGVVLLFLGFYDLRKINKELHTAWIFSIINLVFHVLNLIYLTTSLHIRFNRMGIAIFLSTLFQITFFLIFRSGLNKIFHEAAVKPYKDPLLWLIIWRIVIVICAITQLGSIWFIALPLICFYFYNFRSLYKFGDLLSQINFKFHEGDNRFSRKRYFAGYLASCIFIVILCSSLSNHIKLDAKEFVKPNTSETRQKLIGLGFPENILKDISEDEVALLEDAIYVDAFSELLMFDPKEETVKGEFNVYTTKEKPGKINLEVTSIYVELDNGTEESTMYSFQYFQWQDGGAYWYDGIKVRGTVPLELISGRLLYEKDGISYLADIPRLKNEMVSETDWFGYTNNSEQITGAVSYPFSSDNQRGYVFYKLKLNKDLCYGGNIFKYIHYQNPVRIPYEETELSGILSSVNIKSLYTNFERKIRSSY